MDSNVKAALYQSVAALRTELHLAQDCYPLDLPTACRVLPNLSVASVRFAQTPGLRGIAAPGQPGQNDIILLNENKSPREQSFICGHELLHLVLHRGRELRGFSCFDDVRARQNPFWEWQANEGSAELHLPLRMLLAEVANEPGLPDDWRTIERLKRRLRVRFGLTEAMVRLRLESLKYELEQFFGGIAPEHIQLLTERAQRKLGIHARSLNDRAAEDLARSARASRGQPDDAARLMMLEDARLFAE